MNFIRTLTIGRLLIPLLAVGFIYAGCDSDSGGNDATDEVIQLQGVVTDDAGYGKSAGTIEGALVTAATIESNGALNDLEAEATTEADGSYDIGIGPTSDVIVLTATKSPFRAQVLALQEPGSFADVGVMPANMESSAEAAVYIGAAAQGLADSVVTLADVAFLVNSALAAEFSDGNVTSDAILTAIRAGVEAEADYITQGEGSEEDLATVRGRERRAFRSLQADLHEATDAESQAHAMAEFTRALVDAYTEAGIDLDAQAEARQSAQSALTKFAPQGQAARDALVYQAAVLTVLTTTGSIEAAFQDAGVSPSRMDSLIRARTTLVETVAASTMPSEIQAARALYAQEVELVLSSELALADTTITAVDAALAAEIASLEAALSGGGTANEVATAYMAFYPRARASVETALAEHEDAELGARVYTLLRVE